MKIDRNKKKIINYPPEKLRSFNVIPYRWIDNLNFTIRPEECLEDVNDYLNVVKDMFLEAGWDGDGEIELMWIPPFMLKLDPAENSTLGVTIWHVKQLEDGISWMLSPIQFPYYGN